MKQPFTILPSGGMVTGDGLYRNQNTFRRLINVRPAREGGFFEQTEGFYSYAGPAGTSAEWVAGNWYNRNTAAPVADTGTEKPSMIIGIGANILAFTKTGARTEDGTRIPSWRQINAAGVSSGLSSGCMAIFGSAADMTLGQILEVECTSATQFQWRIGGGAFTGPVTIDLAGNTLAGKSITLYFLTDDDHTIIQSWQWMRDDALYETHIAGIHEIELEYQWPNVFIGDYLYFLDWSGRLMKYNITTKCCMSAGYHFVYGTDLSFYENHLFIANSTLGISVTNTFGKVSCSDLENPDNFIPTDTNEADTYSRLIGLPNLGENREHTKTTKIHGMFIVQGVLFIVTDNGMWATTYAGLGAQSPFNFRPQFSIAMPILNTEWRKGVVTERGVYFWTAIGIVFFNGSALQVISEPINSLLLQGNSADIRVSYIRYGVYDPAHKEVLFYWESTDIFSTYGFLVYQELTGSWYFRAAHFDAQTRGAACIAEGQLHVAGAGQVIKETKAYGLTLLNDYAAGLQFQNPTIETQDLDFGALECVKELDPLWLEVEYSTLEESGSNGTEGVDLSVATRKKVGDTVNYNASTFLNADLDGSMGVRASGRIFRFKITPVPAEDKRAHGFKFHQLKLFVRGLPNVKS